MGAAAINIIGLALQVLFRLLIRESGYAMTPDMMSGTLWDAQVALSRLMLICLGLLFRQAFLKQRHDLSLVDKDDQLSMAMLQREVFGEDVSALSGEVIAKLLQIWAVILVGARLVYELCAGFYRQFISALTLLSILSADVIGDGFIAIYNGSHGFKYLGMFVALLLGVMMTGIFLDDMPLKIASFILACLFLLFFGVMQMNTVNIFGQSIGIVWTSVIFHLTDTLGIVILAIYMRYKYKGV